MTDRPQSVDRYIVVAKEIAKLTKEKDALRSEVLDLLQDGGWDDIHIQTSNSEDLDDDLLYEWIKETFPKALVDELTENKLNCEMFKSLVDLQVIELTKIPDSCFVRTTTQKIMTSRRKKNENQG